MLETKRLILRRFEEQDVDAIFNLRRDAEMMRFIREPQKNRKESERWIKLVSSLWETDKIGFCAVIEKKSSKVIGWCGLWKLTETREIEVGYAIAKEFWKQGYAHEAADAFLDYGFERLKLDKIAAVARPENISSLRVMEKLGMGFDYIGKFYGFNLAHHSISRKDWFNLQRLKSVDLQIEKYV